MIRMANEWSRAVGMRELATALFLLAGNYCLLRGWSGGPEMACTASPAETEPCCPHALPPGDGTPSAAGQCCNQVVVSTSAPTVAKLGLARSTPHAPLGTVPAAGSSTIAARGTLVSSEIVPPVRCAPPPLRARPPPLS